MISMLSGRPMSGLPAARASKNARACRGAVKVMVVAASTWRMEMSRQ